MAPYAAQLAIHFPYTSADLSATARYAWSMLLALRIAVPVLFEHSVRKPPRRTNQRPRQRRSLAHSIHSGSIPSSPSCHCLRAGKDASSRLSCPCSLGRLATLSVSSELSSSAAHTNRRANLSLSSLRRGSIQQARWRANPSTTSPLASQLAAAHGSQCLPIFGTGAHHHDLRTSCRFCPVCGCKLGHRCLKISCPTRLLLLGLFCSRLPLH